MGSGTIATVLELGLMVLAYIAMSLAAIAVHEAGHVVAGLLCRFRIIAVRVGPIRLFSGKGQSLSYTNWEGLSGDVSAQFREMPGRWASWQIAGFVIGGPAASLCGSLLAFAIGTSLPTGSGVLIFFAIVSLFMGVANVVPWTSRGRTSDGAKLCNLAFSRAKRQRLVELHSFTARIKEASTLCGAGKYAESLKQLEIVIAMAAAMDSSFGDQVFARKLFEFRDNLRNAAAQVDAPQTEAS